MEQADNTQARGNAQDNAITPRMAALEILSDIIDKHQPLDACLQNNKTLHTLDTRDRAFARMLISTTLRRLGQIDHLIEKAQERPDALKTPRARNILRLGAAQLFFMDVPDHAAVDTSVQLADKTRIEKQKAFINAVLRKFSRDGRKWVEQQDAPRLNTPDWLLKSWIADYGLGTAAKIAQANMNEAPLDITIKDETRKPYWANTLKASELSTGTLRRVSGGNIIQLEGFSEGEWWVQDAAAALPALLLGQLEGQEVYDLCAAPGGKTMQLAARGANVTAIDRSAARMKRLEENLERVNLHERVTIEIADAAVWTPKAPVQSILLDAPCSATGTIRRHPDAQHLKSPVDIERLSALQERLLDHAGKILEPGGTLIYCTCSMQKAEGEHQIEEFLSRTPDIQRNPVQPNEIGNYEELINENGDLRILPCHLGAQGGLDGFFISRLTKKA